MSTAFNTNRVLDDENSTQTFLPTKQIHSERKHTIRKQALGEIKNVMHNQPSSITPFKGIQQIPTKTIFSDLLKKRSEHVKSKVDQSSEQTQRNKIAPTSTKNVGDIRKPELPAPRTCNEKCHKSLGEIWSEMNVLDPDTLERLVNGNGDLEDVYDIRTHNLTPIDFDEEFDLAFDLHDPFVLDDNKLLGDLMAKDYGHPDIPPVLDWFEDL